jgi:6-pyruvoyltetrahydropterin/6-carboxytetrahydropterin synthase
MVIDFSILKKDVKEILDYYDHAFIVEEGSLKKKTMECLNEEGFRVVTVNFRPTAEEFSKCFFYRILEKNYQVKRVTVYETPTNSASYENNEVHG